MFTTWPYIETKLSKLSFETIFSKLVEIKESIPIFFLSVYKFQNDYFSKLLLRKSELFNTEDPVTFRSNRFSHVPGSSVIFVTWPATFTEFSFAAIESHDRVLVGCLNGSFSLSTGRSMKRKVYSVVKDSVIKESGKQWKLVFSAWTFHVVKWPAV